MTTTTDHETIGRQTVRDADPEVIEVVEEFAHVSVARRETGGVRVRLLTDEVQDVHQVALSSQQVELTRHPVGREIDTVPEPREEGDLLILPVVEERAVLVKKLVLVEEIHIRRTRSTETVNVPVTLRRQQAVVEALEPVSADLRPDANGSDRRDF